MPIQNERQPLIDSFLDWNSKINLSAIRDPEGVFQKHIIDSLEVTTLADKYFLEGKTILDIGTGGGFPLLPMAIHYPKCSFTGLDARKKKTVAIEGMISELGIHNAKTVWSRAEDHKVRYDIVTARAVAYADQLMQRCLHRTKKGGIIIRRKMHTIEEQAEIREQCLIYNLTLIEEHRYTLQDDETPRVIYIIKK